MMLIGILWALFMLACISFTMLPGNWPGGIIIVVFILFNLDIFIPIAIVVGLFFAAMMIYGIILEEKPFDSIATGSNQSKEDDDPTLGGWY